MAFCTNCGKPLNADMKFCPNCGTPVPVVSTPAPAPAQTPTASVVSTPVQSSAAADHSFNPLVPKLGKCKVLLNSWGSCNAQSAALILQNLLDYSEGDVRLLMGAVPTLIAKDLTEEQAYFVTQTLFEYGMITFYLNEGRTVKPNPQAPTVFDANCALKDEVFEAIASICPQQRFTVFTHLG